MPFTDGRRETLEPQLLSHVDYLNPYSSRTSFDLFFYEHVKAYTSRSLTLDSDGLNAFEGIIKSGNTKSFWGIVSYRLNSELGFAIGLAWSGLNKPPRGRPIRRREGFLTWSWVSLVDRIETPTRAIGSRRNILACSAFYAENEIGHRERIADIYKRTPGSGALLFSNFGKALFIKANITQVHLIRSKQAGFYTVHASRSHFASVWGPLTSPVRVKEVKVRIDDDAGLLSSIESYSWSAVQLFGKDKKIRPGLTESEHHWMLVDEREPIARRIGIITPVYNHERRVGEHRHVQRSWIKNERFESAKEINQN